MKMINLPKNKREWSLAIMVIVYLAAGFNHFFMPAFYYPLIPDYLGFKATINTLSGLAEILLAIMLVFPQTRRLAGWGIIVMLVAFLPAHIWMITQGGCFQEPSFCLPVWMLWIRLLVLHPLLAGWAWWTACSRPQPAA